MGQYRTDTEDQARRQWWEECRDGGWGVGAGPPKYAPAQSRRRKIVHPPAHKRIHIEWSHTADTEEAPVDTVTLSPTYQIVIPQAVCRMLKLVPGQELQVVVDEDRLTLIPLRNTAAELRGFLRGIDTTLERDTDRE